MHRTVLLINIVQREPTADQLCGKALPVSIVLVPKDGLAATRRLVERLIVKELNVRPHQIFDDIDDSIVVEEFSEQYASLAHLRDLEHLSWRIGLRVNVVGIADREIAVASISTGLGEYAVVLVAQVFDQVAIKQGTNSKVATFAKVSDLILV